jgi:heat shock protein HtpX
MVDSNGIGVGVGVGVGARAGPIVLVVVGLLLAIGFGRAWRGDLAGATAPWWAYLFLMILAVAMLALAAAVSIDPRPLQLRQSLAGAALVWLVVLVVIAVGAAGASRSSREAWLLVILAVAVGAALVDLAVTTKVVAGPTGDVGPFQRLGAVIVFALAIFMAAGAAVIVVSLVRAVWRSIATGQPVDRLPWGMVLSIAILPLITFAIAAIGSRRAAGGTFQVQATANRRNSVLLVITLVGIVAATAEVIAVTLTYDPVPALWAAAVAALIGLGAAAAANRFGSDVILQAAGARLADPARDSKLLDVVRELSIAANVPEPRVFVIADGSQNAFATGRDPNHASLAVTTGLLVAMDREELQGVIGHELGHVRNLDTRYALYVAVLVGLVALVTDSFLRLVIEGWRNGAFVWAGDDDNALAGLAMGFLVGIFLLIVAGLLRVVAPLFSALVQASSSREREFLADATSVEFTRNPQALERALASIAADDNPLEAANRGTQHLWFRNPVKAGSDRRTGLLATHPSLAARIDRLRALQGLEPLDPEAAAGAAAET